MTSTPINTKLISEKIFLIAVLVPLSLSIALISTQVKSPRELFLQQKPLKKIKKNIIARIENKPSPEPEKNISYQPALLESLKAPSLTDSSSTAIAAGLVSSGAGKGSLVVTQGEARTGEIVNDVSSGSRAARAVNVVAPQYPQSAQERGLSGFVIVEVTLNERGQILNLNIVESSPARVFDSAAIEAVRGWTFEPAILDGKPIVSKTKQKVNFELD